MDALPPRRDNRNHAVLLEEDRKKLLSVVHPAAREAFALIYTELQIIKQTHAKAAAFIQEYADEHLILSLNAGGRRFDSIVKVLTHQDEEHESAAKYAEAQRREWKE